MGRILSRIWQLQINHTIKYMKIPQHLVLAVLSFCFATALTAAPEAKTIAISAFDTMKYSVSKIEASPGQKITVVLTNGGNVPKIAMGHNWILLKAGVDPVKYATAAMAAKNEDYQPKSMSDKVLASIPLLGPKETGKTTFTAPTTPGSYAFFCSFPAHIQAGMKGLLIVK